MPLTIIRTAPDASAYTPLSDFQSGTPVSFSTPVLYHLERGARVLIAADQARLLPVFGSPAGSDELTIGGIDLWVTNENLILFNGALGAGVAVPYLSLTLHAVQRVGDAAGVYMQLSLTPDIAAVSNADEFDDEELVELTLLPAAGAADAIFKALSACTSLHSAASGDEGDDEGADRILFEGDAADADDGYARLAGFPGDGGWITAENAHEFRFADADADGDDGAAILGPGAGSVRRRDAGEGGDDSKWRRTD